MHNWIGSEFVHVELQGGSGRETPKKQKESSHYALSVNTENPDYDKSQRRPKQKGGGRGLEYCSRNKESERNKMS